jgi:RNA polymerase sigma-70 factor (ECF subfamily)
VRDDLRLARRIQGGDPRAFEEFLDSYGARVQYLVRRTVENRTDAEDLTQEIFVHLYRNIGSYRGDAALATWVYRVALNQCAKHAQKRPPQNVALEEQNEQASPDWRSNPEQAAVKSELSERVHDALEQLSPLHKEVVVLHELYGLTYQECAQALQVPIGTVKSRLFNAIRRLRDGLSEYVLGDAGGGVLRVEAAAEKTP